MVPTSEILELAESEKTKTKSNPWVEFCFGCFLIPFAFALLWKNEKKLVTYSRCISQAKKECQNIDCEKPIEDYDMALVHCKGKTRNEVECTDTAFGTSVSDSYRLIRTVEMY